MNQEFRITAPLEHPSYSGHFPGHPIVAGVLLLDLLVAQLGRGAPCAINQVKFHHAVRPGDALVVRATPSGLRLEFRCVRDTGELVADGTLTFRGAT